MTFPTYWDCDTTICDRNSLGSRYEKDKMNDHRFANAAHGAHAVSTAEIKLRITEMFADSSEPDAVESTPR